MANRKCRVFFLIITLIVNALDFISDWLFYISARKVEQGLVYGPISQTQITALLVFSIIGSVGFVVEIGVFIFELRKGGDFHGDLLLDLISAVFIWLEDIPQVVISFSIALCREEAISIFQLTKAGIVLVGVVISIVATITRFCRTYDSKAKVCWIRLFLIFGIFIEAAFAGAIFYLTQTEPDSNGVASFKVPTTVLEDHLSDQKYLTNVSLFVHHSDSFDAYNLDTNKKDTTLNWLNLVPLSDIKENKHMSFKIQFDNSQAKKVNFAIWKAATLKSSKFITWIFSECYFLDQESTDATLLSKETCENATFFSDKSETFFIDFQFEKPDNGMFYKKRVFGEIYFNMKVLKNGICSDGNFEDPQRNGGSLYYPLTLHYYRINSPSENTDVVHLYKDKYNMTRLFSKNSMEITDVADAWKTGWNECRSTGSTTPVLDKNMQLRCI